MQHVCRSEVFCSRYRQAFFLHEEKRVAAPSSFTVGEHAEVQSFWADMQHVITHKEVFRSLTYSVLPKCQQRESICESWQSWRRMSKKKTKTRHSIKLNYCCLYHYCANAAATKRPLLSASFLAPMMPCIIHFHNFLHLWTPSGVTSQRVSL